MEERKYKNKFIIIVLVLTIISVMLGASYALLIWHSENNTELTVRIGDVAGVYFETGPNINVSNLGPVFDYEKDGESTYFTISNYVNEDIVIDANLNITNITSNLKEESFKYVIMSSYDNVNYTKVKEDSFVNVNNGDTITIFNELKLSANSTISYKIILYIDGNMLNPISMQNGSLSGVIQVSEHELPPVINNVSYSVTTNSITLQIDATDTQSGVDKYYCSSNGSSYTESATSSCTLTGLNPNTNYNVKVYATDKKGYSSDIYSLDVKTSNYSYLFYSYYMDGDGVNDYGITKYNLTTGNQEKIVTVGTDSMTIVGNYLYYSYDWNISRYNLLTGENEMDVISDYANVMVATDEYLFYSYYMDGDGEDDYGITKYNLTTGNKEKIVTAGTDSMTIVGNYLYYSYDWNISRYNLLTGENEMDVISDSANVMISN